MGKKKRMKGRKVLIEKVVPVINQVIKIIDSIYANDRRRLKLTEKTTVSIKAEDLVIMSIPENFDVKMKIKSHYGKTNVKIVNNFY
jgi:hypothetical protein